MATYRTDIDVDGPVEALFDHVANFSTAQEWDPGVVEARRLDDGPLGVGSEFRVVVSVPGRRLPLHYVVRDYDRPRLVVLEAESSMLRSYDTIRVQPAGDRARVTYEAELTLKGVSRVAEPLLRLAFRRIGDRAAAGLRESLERVAAGSREQGAVPDGRPPEA